MLPSHQLICPTLCRTAETLTVERGEDRHEERYQEHSPIDVSSALEHQSVALEQQGPETQTERDEVYPCKSEINTYKVLQVKSNLDNIP